MLCWALGLLAVLLATRSELPQFGHARGGESHADGGGSDHERQALPGNVKPVLAARSSKWTPTSPAISYRRVALYGLRGSFSRSAGRRAADRQRPLHTLEKKRVPRMNSDEPPRSEPLA